MTPRPITKTKLTGKVRGRVGVFGRVLMQIEIQVDVFPGYPNSTELLSSYTVWRDAKPDDLMALTEFSSK